MIDLSLLPAPQLIEDLDVEAILAAMIADFQARYPALTMALESDPVVKLLETAAYRELLVRGRINDEGRAVLLAYATGTDLDQLAAWWGVTRRVIIPGDPAAVPPAAEIVEDDQTLRLRTQGALEGLTCAGSIAAYRWHAREASPLVLDANPHSVKGGVVTVPVLSTVGDGVADAPLLALVRAALNAEVVRPLCDRPVVVSAAIVPYAIVATLHIAAGPDPATVRAAALAAVTAYTAATHRIAARVALSGLDAALHQTGVEWVDITSPTESIICGADQAPHCVSITLT